MLAYERLGSGEPLVLVHGIGHRRHAWYPVLDRLAEQREVFLIDLPGHGESPGLIADGRPVKELLTEALVTCFDELGLDRPHIAGNSLGGRIALEAAADGLVSSATALSPAGFWCNSLDFAYVRALFAGVLTGASLAGRAAPPLLHTSAARRVLLAPFMTRGHHLDAARALGDLHGMVAARPALATIIDGGFPFDSDIPADIPVTIAWGTHDLVLLPYQALRARRQLPNAAHSWLRGCGHVPMSDDAERVADILLRGSSSGTATTVSTSVA
ncbi:alpha/beta fold hydrolase [Nocardioides limicola]|uniref:alpha/beta fold hydrolase n=1 Tax=Nocardioides limicola TaxID=2803368 RepID=UPI00193C3ED6|nr:alpha/beta fold hydrolase [Nocardioides sp. DJM-14]